MAKNKNRQQPAKQQQARSSQDTAKSSSESTSEQTSQPPSPLDLAHKGKQKKFGHN